MNNNIARVASALLIDYTSVYYIDSKTGYYECYSTNQGYQKLELQSSGDNFFADVSVISMLLSAKRTVRSCLRP